MTRREFQGKDSSFPGLRFYSYENLGHSVNDQELADLFVWILFLLPDPDSVPDVPDVPEVSDVSFFLVKQNRFYFLKPLRFFRM